VTAVLKIALGQIPVTMGDKRANVSALLRAIEEASAEKADVVVLPECSLTGWLSPAARRLAELIPGPLTKRLGLLARRKKMAIVIGLEEKNGARIHNSAVFIDRRGEILLHHRKVNELEIGLKLYARGESLRVADFAGIKVALSICADSWTPEVTDALYVLGARIIFSPCAWAIQPGGEKSNLAWIGSNYAARTRGRNLHIVAPNGVGPVTQGPWKGRVLQGGSLVFGPGGKKLLQGPLSRSALLTCLLPSRP